MTLDEMVKNDQSKAHADEISDESDRTKPISDIKISSKSDSPGRTIRVGSRKSKLAIIQAECVIRLLNENYNASNEVYKFELSTISTKGDKILDIPLSNIGSKALFTKELEVALLDNEIDFIVHSCKDLPTNLPPGLCISALIRRETPDDVLVVKRGLEKKFRSASDFIRNHHLLFENKSIGTSSLRRIAQLKRMNDKIQIADIRGNIDTRLNKLDADDSPYSALVLAGAGLKRGGFGDRITAVLNENWWYAVGQGALAIECREGDEFIQNLLYPLIDHRTTFEVLAERSFMQYLEGGCSTPLGVRCAFLDDERDLGHRIIDKTMDKNEGEIDVKCGDDNGQLNAISEDEQIKRDQSTKRQCEEDEERAYKRQRIEYDDISKLQLSGVLISLDGKKSVEYRCELKDIDLNSIDKDKIDCTKIVLPTDKCPRMDRVREQFYSCAMLGIHTAKQLQKQGANSILDEIKKNRKPLDN